MLWKGEKYQETKIPQYEPDLKYETSMKFVFLGDFNTGKTSIIQAYINGTFSESYTPTAAMDNFTTVKNYKGVNIKVDICDNSASEMYARLRPISYTNTDCFIICCDLAD